jgi:hypothetical protein
LFTTGPVDIAICAPPGDMGSGLWYLLTERSVPRMNTKNKQNQKGQHQKTQQKQGQKTREDNPSILHDYRKPHEQEHPETRLTR